MSKPNSSATRKQGKSVILYAAKSKQIEEQIDIFSLFPTEVQIDQKFRTHTVQAAIQDPIDFFCNVIEHDGMTNWANHSLQPRAREQGVGQ